MTLSWIHDRCKIGFLLLSYLGCLSTLLTTPSFEMGNLMAPNLVPNLGKWCKQQNSAVRECQKTSSSASANDSFSLKCEKEQISLRTCENTVSKVYRYINLGGCLRHNQGLALCNAEWCQGRQVDRGQCDKECAQSKSDLDHCIDQTVTRCLKRKGWDT